MCRQKIKYNYVSYASLNLWALNNKYYTIRYNTPLVYRILGLICPWTNPHL